MLQLVKRGTGQLSIAPVASLSASYVGGALVSAGPLPEHLGTGGGQRRSFGGNKAGSFEKRYGGQSHKELPDFIEKWGRSPFYALGTVAGAGSVLAGITFGGSAWAGLPVMGCYWWLGMKDIGSDQAVRRNFPVLGHLRYILESIRPEIRQYFIESDTEATPFSRERRGAVYKRAKGLDATVSFGTRGNVYEDGYEFIAHSNLGPAPLASEEKCRVLVGPRCRQPYSASLLNVSAMSYGALSKNAILALNGAAKAGGFYHNTGEGGISPFHKEPGGDIVWNIGTGYFGCRTHDGRFNEDMFMKNASHETVRMLEVKLSQGAKPGHGGLLPASKLTAELAEIRGIPMGTDCHSPSTHNAFHGPAGLIEFMARLREMSGKPVGFKLCVGSVEETASIVRAMHELQDWPDFITVDGGEGGTGAAPFEFTTHVGFPLREGLVIVDDLLRGAGMRDKVRIICSGKVTSGFGIVKNLALGADFCNSARAMLFALGCIQALKCNTNKCPTGITTQDPTLMQGLVVQSKVERVRTYQQSVVRTSAELIAASGCRGPSEVTRRHVIQRVDNAWLRSYADMYPMVPEGALLRGEGPPKYQAAFDNAVWRP